MFRGYFLNVCTLLKIMENVKKLTVPDTILIIPALILAINFFYRLLDEAKLMFYFPFDIFNDISSNIAQLFFLDNCGFYQVCNYWYNGFMTFKLSQPGWYIFTYPILLLVKDPKIATYISMVLIYVLGLLIIWFYGKRLELSRIKRTALFFFWFGNAATLGNLMRLGRPHELLAWIFFLVLVLSMFYYKKIGKYNIFIPGLFYGLIIYTHQTTAILSALLFACCFFVMKNERIKVVLSFLLALVLASPWLVPFVLNFFSSRGAEHILTVNLLDFTGPDKLQNIGTIIGGVSVLLIIYSYLKYFDKSDVKKELLFLFPIILLLLAFISRLVIWIPVLMYVYPDPYITFFSFFGIFLFLQTKFRKIPNFNKILGVLLILVSLTSVFINIVHTPYFPEYNKDVEIVIKSLPFVRENFVTYFNADFPVYSKALYSYAPIYANKSTALGWYPHVKSPSYINDLDESYRMIKSGDCNGLVRYKQYNITEVIANGNNCRVLYNCGLKINFAEDQVCVMSL